MGSFRREASQPLDCKLRHEPPGRLGAGSWNRMVPTASSPAALRLDSGASIDQESKLRSIRAPARSGRRPGTWKMNRPLKCGLLGRESHADVDRARVRKVPEPGNEPSDPAKGSTRSDLGRLAECQAKSKFQVSLGSRIGASAFGDSVGRSEREVRQGCERRSSSSV